MYHPLPGVNAGEATTAGDLIDRPRMVHALSFDVEDWFHLRGLAGIGDSARWTSLPSLVERYTEMILETLARHRVRATFFMLGWVCHRYPQLAPRIAEGGHELAIHSYWHHRCENLTRGLLYLDLKRTIDLVEQQAGQKVLGFRAPCLSLASGAPWIFDVLVDLGLKYDSSLPLPPKATTTGGVAPRPPARHPLLELPLAVQSIGPLRVPIYSGAALRWLPERFLKRGFAQFERANQPVALCLLPRDFATDCPREGLSLIGRLKHHMRLKHTGPKLERLIARYRFDTCAATLGLTPGDTSASRAA